MQLLRNFSAGIAAYGMAWQFIGRHQLWHFFFLTGGLSLLLFGAVLWLALRGSAALSDYLVGWLAEWFSLGTQGTDLVDLLLRITLFLAVLLLYFKSYKYLLLIFLAPLLARLGEKTQEYDTGGRAGGLPFWRSVWRGIRLSVRSLLLEVSCTVALLLLSLVPVVGLIVPLLLFAVEGYFWGVATLDLRHEYRGLSSRESLRWTWQRREVALANGCTFVLMLAVPLAGPLLAPAWSVVAGGLVANRVP